MNQRALQSLNDAKSEREKERRKEKETKTDFKVPKRHVKLTRRRTQIHRRKTADVSMIPLPENVMLLKSFDLNRGESASRIAEQLSKKLAEMDVSIDLLLEPIEPKDIEKDFPRINLYAPMDDMEEPIKVVKAVASLLGE